VTAITQGICLLFAKTKVFRQRDVKQHGNCAVSTSHVKRY